MFSHSPSESVNGTHLCAHVEEEVGLKVSKLFKPSPDGYVDEEKGYEGLEYRFLDEEGQIYNLYSRWGSWRLGGYNLSHGDIGKFVQWAKSL